MSGDGVPGDGPHTAAGFDGGHGGVPGAPHIPHQGGPAEHSENSGEA
ncbi:hypothetical protein ACWV95_14855 [Streptomyces albus]